MNTTNIVLFNFHRLPVRTVEANGKPAFIVRDVCKILGIRNTRDAFNRLHIDERDGVALSDSIGRSQKTQVCYEPGLYRLIFRSRKPEAEEFKRWVFHEVLPTIRRTGFYALPGVAAGKALRTTRRRNAMVDELTRERTPGVDYVSLSEFWNARRVEPAPLWVLCHMARAAKKECQRQGLGTTLEFQPHNRRLTRFYPESALRQTFAA